MEKLISFGGKLRRTAGVAMLLTLVLFLFAAHSHHLFDRYGNPDSACSHGAAHSHVHWPEAGDDYASPVPEKAVPGMPAGHSFTPAATVAAPESLAPEAPQHVPIHA